MVWRVIGFTLVATLVVAALMAVSPGVRTEIGQAWSSVTGWTEKAKQKDPVGFIKHVREKLEGQITELEAARSRLAGELAKLGDKIKEESALQDQAGHLAQEFRAAYQKAKGEGGFPVVVRGAAYTEEQLCSQVSVLLSESESRAKVLQDLKKLHGDLSKQMEEIIVRLSRNKAQLVALSAKEELLRSRQLRQEEEQMLAEVDRLVEGNASWLRQNPVRSVEELLRSPATPEQSQQTVTQDKVRAFLEGSVEISHEQGDARQDSAVDPATYVQPSQQPVQGKPKVSPKQGGKSGKPIYQQM